MNYQLEICCYHFQSCINAMQAGAHRIELCADAASGGTTASFGAIQMVKEKINLPIYPIIRPRGGNFIYSDEEYLIMQKDILLCKELGCEGIVIGILDTNKKVDKQRTAKLVELAYPAEVTFHRAFDHVNDPFEAVETIIDIGCTRILSSGLQPTAIEGKDLLAKLIQQADDRIIIMPGSGVRASNIAVLAKETGATEFHSSAGSLLADKMEIEGMLREL